VVEVDENLECVRENEGDVYEAELLWLSTDICLDNSRLESSFGDERGELVGRGSFGAAAIFAVFTASAVEFSNEVTSIELLYYSKKVLAVGYRTNPVELNDPK
jgi:hypothetical protein